MRKMNSEINGVVNQLKKIKDVKGIYLFGSMAKDKATPISDIDICVITDRVNNDVKDDMLKNAGIGIGERILSLVRKNQVHITKNPVQALWGSLSSKKDALKLKEEAYESLGELSDEKLS